MNIRSFLSNGFMNLFSTTNSSNKEQPIPEFCEDIYTNIEPYLKIEDKINLKQVCKFFIDHKVTELKNEDEQLNKIYSIFREEMHTQLLRFLANKYEYGSQALEDQRQLVEKTEDQLSNFLATLSKQSDRIREKDEMMFGLLFIAASINYYVNGIQAPVFLEKMQPDLLISTYREFFFHLSLTDNCENDRSDITLLPGLVFFDHDRFLTYKTLLDNKIIAWLHSGENNRLNGSNSLICQMLCHLLPFVGHELEKGRIHTAMYELLGEQHERLSKLAKTLCKAIALKLDQLNSPAPKNPEDKSELIKNSLKC